MDKTIKKILVVNQYQSDNLGDKLLNKMLCSKIRDLGFEADNAGFAQIYPQEVDYAQGKFNKRNVSQKIKSLAGPKLKYYLKYKKTLKKAINKINFTKYIGIIIGGGQLIKHHSVFMYCFSFWVDTAVKAGIPIIVFGVGADSSLNEQEIKYYKKYLSKAEKINCRDKETAKILQNILKKTINISPDIAFIYKPKINDVKNYIVVMPYQYMTAKKAFGIDLSKEQYYDEIINKINNAKRCSPQSEIVLTATTSVDMNECIAFNNYIKQKQIQHKVLKIQTFEQLADLFERANVVITGRMHAMILGLVCDATVSPIRISDKVREFEKEYIQDFNNIEDISMKAEIGLENILQDLFN